MIPPTSWLPGPLSCKEDSIFPSLGLVSTVPRDGGEPLSIVAGRVYLFHAFLSRIKGSVFTWGTRHPCSSAPFFILRHATLINRYVFDMKPPPWLSLSSS